MRRALRKGDRFTGFCPSKSYTMDTVWEVLRSTPGGAHVQSEVMVKRTIEINNERVNRNGVSFLKPLDEPITKEVESADTRVFVISVNAFVNILPEEKAS